MVEKILSSNYDDMLMSKYEEGFNETTIKNNKK